MRQANVTFHCYGLYHWTLSTLVPALSGPSLLAAGPNGTGLAMLATAAAPQAPPSTATVKGDLTEAEMSAGEWVDACFLRHSAPWVVGYCVAYTAVFVVGVVGNCCVLRVVSRNASMKNSAFHALLVNLAVADLMVIVFCLPVTLVGHLFGPWLLGLFVCKSVSYLQGVSVCASVNTLMAISIDRYYAICYPMKRQISLRTCRVVIAVIWAFSLTITLPWTFFFRLMPMLSESETTLQVCREDWPTEGMGVLYFIVANLVLCYLLPLCVITLCYVFIWLKVWRRRPPGEAHDFGVENIIQRSKIKVAKMLLVVVVVFAISWLPLYAIFARLKMGEPLADGSLEQSLIEVAAPVAQWLGASNSCINPILYAFFNSKFRMGFKAILFRRNCCCCCWCCDGANGGRRRSAASVARHELSCNRPSSVRTSLAVARRKDSRLSDVF
ncbi:neuropeptide SIFamide receptor [Dermacentor silvarum]|uniref:neuropeptide SIFamide receptor n=1 Tax=Dermacentor silvarum TaxID=543639 RepID=UPI00189AAD0A|nr:neuropeptide SIFamide receptor [Dermacentor silvarum]